MARKPVKSSVSVRGGATCILSCTIPAYADRRVRRALRAYRWGTCRARGGFFGGRKGASPRARPVAAGAAARRDQPRLAKGGGNRVRRATLLRAAALRYGIGALRELP